jgi:hypothetical protein
VAFVRACEATPNRRSTSGDVEEGVDRLSIWQLSAAIRHGQRNDERFPVASAPFGSFGNPSCWLRLKRQRRTRRRLRLHNASIDERSFSAKSDKVFSTSVDFQNGRGSEVRTFTSDGCIGYLRGLLHIVCLEQSGGLVDVLP